MAATDYVDTTFSITFEGLEELCKDIEKVEKKAPDYMRKAIDKAGRRMRKDAAELTKSKLKYKTKEGTGNLIKGFRASTVLKLGSLRSFESQVRGGCSKAKHFHLIENGHRRTVQIFYRGKKGKERVFYKSSLGFTPGYHTMEKTKEEWNNGNKLVPYAQEAVEKALKEGLID